MQAAVILLENNAALKAKSSFPTMRGVRGKTNIVVMRRARRNDDSTLGAGCMAHVRTRT